jgi:hypothetical protein
VHEGCDEVVVLPMCSVVDRPFVPAGKGSDPERSAYVASRRAASAMRRYCVRHRLDRQWDLTYRPEDLPDDEAGVWRDIAAFRRRVYDHFGRTVPLLFVVQHGDRTGRLHAHAGAPEYIDQRVLERLWGHGWASVERKKVADGRKLGARARARRTAGYLAHYVSKEGRLAPGTHRYSTTRATEPGRTVRRFRTFELACRWAAGVLEADGAVAVLAWSSADVEDWRAPPVWLIQGEDPPSDEGG